MTIIVYTSVRHELPSCKKSCRIVYARKLSNSANRIFHIFVIFDEIPHVVGPGVRFFATNYLGLCAQIALFCAYHAEIMQK